jgi:DNA polymerase V
MKADLSEMEIFSPERGSQMPLPLVSSSVEAGFPSPAEDYIEGSLDLNQYLIRKPSATFIIRVKGDSMRGAGIDPGDLLIVDRSATASHRSIVVAMLNGAFTVKRLLLVAGEVRLKPENPAYSEIQVGLEQDFEIWGVVIHAIKSFGVK